MDRGEGFGLTLAIGGHAALFALLSLGFFASADPVKIEPTPIEVALVDDVGLTSTSPVPTSEEPAAKLSPEEAPIEPDSAPPEPVQKPEPAAKPQPAPPKPAPAPDAKAVQKPSKPTSAAPPAKPTTNRTTAPTGRLDGIVNGLSDKPSTSKSTTPPATTAGPEVKASLIAELSRKLRPHWKPPTGADADKLRTVIRVQLDEKGNVVSMGECQQKGTITDSNRPQIALHCDRAKRAVRLAAPFSNFPVQYYNVWKVISPAFDWRLSQ